MKVRKNREAFSRLRSMSDALTITTGDLQGPILLSLGRVHRRQQELIFLSEGALGGSGKWPALGPDYAKRKGATLGRQKILNLTGRTKDRFTKATNPHYIQEFVPTGEASGVFRFGADSDIASGHLRGDPTIATGQSETARSIFSGRASRLPVRDMISKSAEQIGEIREGLSRWYRQERIPQVLRNLSQTTGDF